MYSKPSRKKAPPAPNPGTATGAPAFDSSKKSEEQLAFLNSWMPEFLVHQTAVTLNRFWPQVFDPWYKRWPIVPPPEAIQKHGSSPNAILVLRTENNQVRIEVCFYLVSALIHIPDRSFATGFTIGLAPPPSPQNPTCDLIRQKNGNSLPPRLTAITPGTSASKISLRNVGRSTTRLNRPRRVVQPS